MATAGIGAAVGPERAVVAAKAAVTNPLLNHDLAGAGAILLNVAGASGMTMREVKRAAEVVRSAADPDAMIIFGTIFDDHLDDELRVTVIATRLRDDFAYVHRVASDTRSIAETEEPAPAAAGRGRRCGGRGCRARSGGRAKRSPAEGARRGGARWAAIPIVTSEDEPVPVVASGGTAVAEMDALPSHSRHGRRARLYDVCRAGSASRSQRPRSSPGSPQPMRPRPWSRGACERVRVLSQPTSLPGRALSRCCPRAIRAGRSSSGARGTVLVRPGRRDADEASEGAEQPRPPRPRSSASSESELGRPPLARADEIAQSEPARTVSELEPAEEPPEEPAPTEPVLTARPYEALGSRALGGRHCARCHDIRAVRAGPSGF